MLTTMLLSLTLVAGSHKPRVAVLDFTDISGRDAATARLLTQVASSEVAAFHSFELITSQSIAAVLGVEKQKQLLGCNDNSACLAEIGGALGASYLVSGQVGRLGRRFRLDVTLVDAERSKVLASKGDFFDDEGSLGEGVGKLVRQAFSDAKLVDLQPVAASAATPPVAEAAKPAPGEVSHVPSYVAFGVGGVAAVVGIVFTGLAIKDYGAITTATPAHDPSRSHQLTEARIADVSWAGAIIAGGVGAGLWFMAGPSPAGAGGEVAVGGRF